ncbi:hypothetical protein HAX54_031080, partial [Datura stramonium]|nr:hypothetical protein [Datura stramonium]
MASRANNGKEVATSSKEIKWHRKRVAPSSSVPKALLARCFGAKVWRNIGSNGSMPKKPNMPQRIGLMNPLALEFPPF